MITKNNYIMTGKENKLLKIWGLQLLELPMKTLSIILILLLTKSNYKLKISETVNSLTI
jgi:hypothetical protein